jgi:hypothetical protein
MAGVATTETVMAWRRVIADQEHGDETQGEFCARRGLKLETFRNWKYRFARGERSPRGRSEPVRFVPVRVVDRGVETTSGIELALPGGRVVRVARGFDPETLKRLVETLETRPC